MTTEAFYADPVRRYMIPVASDRRTDWPSHPHATRDSLHEHDMWVAEGLTHRYPTKVLAELLSTCPQYCGHCTRMDLVGNSTPAVDKLKLTLKPVDRYDAHIAYLKAHPGVRDVVVSGGDVANVPWRNLESYLMRLLDIETDPRHPARHQGARWACPSTGSQPDVVEGLERVARTAARRGVNLAIHTHVNHAQSLTPLVARAAQTALEVGVRDVRNQGVLMRGVNATTADLLDLCFALQGEAGILPYYFYMCDMIPNAEHWRVAGLAGPAAAARHHGLPARLRHPADRLRRAVRRQALGAHGHRVRPRARHLVLDQELPHLHRGRPTPRRCSKRYAYYDPIDTLPESGQQWWAAHRDD